MSSKGKLYIKNWFKNNQERVHQYYKKYYEKNKEKIKLKRRIYREQNLDKVGIILRNWRIDNPLKNKVYRHNRRIKEKGLTTHTIQQVYEDNIKKYGTLTCYLCLKPIQFENDTLEHKTPLSRGGTNLYNNLDIACSRCNNSKGNKTEQEYREWVVK